MVYAQIIYQDIQHQLNQTKQALQRFTNMLKSLGVAITVYDEHKVVLESVENIKKYCDGQNIQLIVSVAHSDSGDETEEILKIRSMANHYTLLPNLGGTCRNEELGSLCISRNYSTAFSSLLGQKYDLVAAFTGDTLIQDASNFSRRFQDMKKNSWKAFVARAIGQKFHAEDTNRDIVKEGRLQHENITDFMPQLFFLDGSLLESGAFTNIKITNKFTSEQCLGDELMKRVPFATNVCLLNSAARRNAYSYSDGVKYHVR